MTLGFLWIFSILQGNGACICSHRLRRRRTGRLLCSERFVSLPIGLRFSFESQSLNRLDCTISVFDVDKIKQASQALHGSGFQSAVTGLAPRDETIGEIVPKRPSTHGNPTCAMRGQILGFPRAGLLAWVENKLQCWPCSDHHTSSKSRVSIHLTTTVELSWMYSTGSSRYAIVRTEFKTGRRTACDSLSRYRGWVLFLCLLGNLSLVLICDQDLPRTYPSFGLLDISWSMVDTHSPSALSRGKFAVTESEEKLLSLSVVFSPVLDALCGDADIWYNTS